MRAVAKTMQYPRNAPTRRYDQTTRTVLAISGAMLTLTGAVLAIGGYLSPEGSAFHMLAGMGLIVSGALVARRHRVGAWTYSLVFAGTVSWSLRNVEVGSSLALRLIGPALLLAMIAVLMPLLCGWRPRQAFAVFMLVIGATIGLGISSLPNGPLAHEMAAVTRFLDAQTEGILQ